MPSVSVVHKPGEARRDGLDDLGDLARDLGLSRAELVLVALAGEADGEAYSMFPSMSKFQKN